MSENGRKDALSLAERREKRRRIDRLKRMIISFILIFILASISLNVYAIVRIHSLQSQVNLISDIIIEEYNNNKPADEASGVASGNVGVESIPLDRKFTFEPNPDIRECLDYSENTLSPGEKPVVYLTFDDGPSTNTDRILEILDRHGVKATFFVNGKENPSFQDCYGKIVEAGHTLGMHSYSHNYSEIYSSVDAFDTDFAALYELIYEKTGLRCTLYRFPGGSSNGVSKLDMNEFIDYLGEKGMTYYDWNVMSGDAVTGHVSAQSLADNVISGVKRYKISVVLMHDAADKDATVDALEIILNSLENMGAEVLPITDDSPVIHHKIKE
ncbi:MAG: polysaccharide deacetylase [Lachnospiraceae bacterium]|nr:polysaccharide deacetylase [Lachnospiraceae bacterium]